MASRAFVYTNAQNGLPALPETAGFACWGSIPNPLNSVSRWLRLCEPDRFFEKMPLPFAGQFAIMLVSQFRRLQKIPAGGGRKSAGTVRSRRMKFCEKGFGGGSHQQAKTDFRRSRRKSVLSICGNKYTACYNGDTPKNGGDGRPMQRPTPKLQWEGTGLTRHCLSFHARLRKLSAGPPIAAFDLRRLRSGQHRPLVSHSKLNR